MHDNNPPPKIDSNLENKIEELQKLVNKKHKYYLFNIIIN